MNEQTKTLAYIGVAALVVVVAVVARPTASATSARLKVPKGLNEIGDPLSARSLQIIEYDEATSTLREFEVAEVEGLWTIPSHENYPADAENQMGEAASSVMNLKVLDMVSHDRSRHADYGVVDPNIQQLRPGATGVGTRVTMKDAKGEEIVHMVIGKEVKDQDEQRYVREVGRDAVYIVKLDPSKLSTTFEDWIEDDLLKLSTFDIRQVELKDYTASVELVLDRGQILTQPIWDRRGELTVAYDSTKSEWSLAELRLFDQTTKDYVSTNMADDQELDTEVLNDLRDALDDLKIVDVERKPEGMSRDLKANVDFLKNNEAIGSLRTKGYIPIRGADDQIEILSAEGEVICQMKDGVEYVLRFGAITNGEGGGSDSTDSDTEKTSADGLNRYIFLLARHNESVIARPELAELPDLPEVKAEEAKGSEEKAEDGEAEDTEVETASKEESTEESTDGEAAATEEGAETSENADAAEESGTEESDTAESDTAESDTAESDAEESDEKSIEAITAERKRLEEENQKKLDEYNKKMKEAREQVQKLNDRFGDWYFIIPDNVYQKIHLNHSTIIKQKDPPADETKDGETPDAETQNDGASPEK